MPPVVVDLPAPVIEIWKAQQALAKHFEHTKLKFTLDGRLVGDIAEAMALEIFDLRLPKKRTRGVDALSKDGKRSVQIKASGQEGSGPAFTPGQGFADHLLFFKFDFLAGKATVEYNGPEAPVRQRLLPAEWTGTKVVKLKDLLALGKELAGAGALPAIK